MRAAIPGLTEFYGRSGAKGAEREGFTLETDTYFGVTNKMEAICQVQRPCN